MQATDPVAVPYAEACIAEAQRKGTLGDVRDQAATVLEALDASAEGLRVLESPRVGHAAKLKVLEGTLRGRCDDVLLHTLGVAVRRGRALHLRAILQEIVRQGDVALGRIAALAQVARPLAADAAQSVQRALAAATGKDVQLTVVERPELVGGIRIRVGDRVVDATLRARLDAMRRRLLDRRIPIEVFTDGAGAPKGGAR